MLHEKVFHVIKKKVDVAQKSISCRQKQDDAASKKYFVHKIAFIFSERRPIASIYGRKYDVIFKHVK